MIIMVKVKYPNFIQIDAQRARGIVEDIRNDKRGEWARLPVETDEEEISRIEKIAAEVQEKAEYRVCIGVGGSYLGHRAVIEALKHRPETERKTQVLYAGNSLDPEELSDVLEKIEGRDFMIDVISKSGGTLGPSVAFKILKRKLFEKYGEEEGRRRIIATTDPNFGMLHDEAVANNYIRLAIPSGVGGRFSVLSPVGLLPMAVAEVNIRALMEGAKHEHDVFLEDTDNGSVLKYAFLRDYLRRQGYDVEVLATFVRRLHYFQEWWKQLFGESEGKKRQGIFPAAVSYTTDLHSMGQYMQEGRRNIFETVIEVAGDYKEETLAWMNKMAEEATVAAHREGGIPVFEIEIDDLTEKTLGELIWFFEAACAISAKLAGVDPFDQPGVEKYKENLNEKLNISREG